jgi:hypothetical protein
MMGAIQLVSEWLGGDRVTQMAERVAGRSRMAVWQRVNQRLPTLGPTEARGYVRARSAAVIHQETERLLEQEGIKVARLRDQIETAARQLLTETIVAQVQQRSLRGDVLRAA